MRAWKANANIEFNFHDAHDINELRNNSSEDVVKRKLRERLTNTKQAIVLIGEKTKNLYRYVRWEIDCCLEMGIPIVGVNLNGKTRIDENLCPPILKEKCVLYVPFKMEPIKRALDGFCANYAEHKRAGDIKLYYPDLENAA